MKINKTLAIMAGGKSSRMNYNNKALLSYKEKTFIENIIEAGKNFKKVVIVANNVQLLGGNTGGSGGMSAGGYNQQRPYQPRNNEPSSQGGYESPYDASPYGGDGDSFPEDIPF